MKWKKNKQSGQWNLYIIFFCRIKKEDEGQRTTTEKPGDNDDEDYHQFTNLNRWKQTHINKGIFIFWKKYIESNRSNTYKHTPYIATPSFTYTHIICMVWFQFEALSFAQFVFTSFTFICIVVVVILFVILPLLITIHFFVMLLPFFHS